MIDIHCHLLNGVDDGAKTIEESLENLTLAEEAGFTDIILTPHYIEGYYKNDKKKIQEKIKELKKEIFKNNILVNVYHGNEIYFCDNMADLLLANVPATLAGSRYVLFEVPFNNKVFTLTNLIMKLKENGFKPILAHPERYSFVQEDPTVLIDLIQSGVLMQSNFGSLLGQYGNHAQKTLRILLENNMVSFLASDTHSKGFVYQNMSHVLKELNKIISKEQIKQLTNQNPKCIIQDEEIQTTVPLSNVKIKERKIFFFKK